MARLMFLVLLNLYCRFFNGLTTALNILARTSECVASEHADSDQGTYQCEGEHFLNCFHVHHPFVLSLRLGFTSPGTNLS